MEIACDWLFFDVPLSFSLRCLIGSSNKPLEWTGPPTSRCLRSKVLACHSGAAFEGDLMPVDPVI
jgi:hypothetical protein